MATAIIVASLGSMTWWQLRGSVVNYVALQNDSFVISQLEHGESVAIPPSSHGIVTCPTNEDAGYRWLGPGDYTASGTLIYEYTPGFASEKERRWDGKKQQNWRQDSPTIARFKAGHTYYVRGGITSFTCSRPYGTLGGALEVPGSGGVRTYNLGPTHDAQGQLVRYSIDLPPKHGTVTITGATATYRPADTFTGSDTFTFMRSDLGDRPTATDQDFLYGVDVATTNSGPVVTYQGISLMKPSNRPYFQRVTNGAGAQVQRTFTTKPGGVDVTFTVSNPTSTTQAHPNLFVPGIQLPWLKSDINVTRTRPPTGPLDAMSYRGGCMLPTGTGCLTRYIGRYPEETYLPAAVFTTDQYALGTSLLYDYPSDWVSVGSQIQQESNGDWQYVVNSFSKNVYDSSTAGRLALSPGETRTYTVALRWSPPRDWLMTLAPYKEHFQETYHPPQKTVRDRDRRPIRMFVAASYYYNSLTPYYEPDCPAMSVGCPAKGVQPTCYNPPRHLPPSIRNVRGFEPDWWPRMTSDTSEPDGVRWKPQLDAMLSRTRDYGFKRMLTWSLAGNYPRYDECDQRNYPPIMATKWMPELEDDRQDWVDAATQNPDIEMGYYWGRTSEVPVFESNGDWLWDSQIQPMDLSNPVHKNFVQTEFQAMLDLGMDTLGMDAPGSVRRDLREQWWSEMLARKPDLKLIAEEPTNDFSNVHAAIWSGPGIVGWYYGGGPNNIAWYLNPGAEQIIQTILNTNDSTNVAQLAQMMRWGYTPLVGSYINVNVSSLTPEATRVVECYNGISADGTCPPMPVRNARPIAVQVPAQTSIGVTVPMNGNTSFTLGPVRDEKGTIIRYALDLPPGHGTATVSGSIATYAADPGYSGPDAFTFMRSTAGDASGPDDNYLYDVDTTVTTMPNGKQNFRVTYNGVVLKEAADTDVFFKTINGGQNAVVTYIVTPRRGGADIAYTVRNPNATGGTAIAHPEFMIPNIKLGANSNALKYLKMNASTMPQLANGPVPATSGLTYPDQKYAPVAAVLDKQFAVGASFLYDFFATQNREMQLEPVIEQQNGTWVAHFRNFLQEPEPWVPQNSGQNLNGTATFLQPQETRTYTVALRFAPPRNWIFTLHPYKQLFQQLYPSTKTTADRDRRPILTFFPCNSSATNPRGFKDQVWNVMTQNGTSSPDWGNMLTGWIQQMKAKNYARSLIWGVGGCYANDQNYPPINATAWLPELNDDRGDFTATFGADPDVDLGFYWGRAGEVPPFDANDNWSFNDNETGIAQGDYDNPQHRNFLTSELQAMIALGANEIGLDAPHRMEFWDEKRWWDDMFSTWSSGHPAQPELKLMMEARGPDFAHRRAAAFDGDSTITGPSDLLWYLNPGSSMMIYMNSATNLVQRTQQLLRWGFTPLGLGSVIPDFTDPALAPAQNPIVECYNGISPDGTCMPRPVRNGFPFTANVTVQ